jgi:addiction module RelE/StbE family toxin
VKLEWLCFALDDREAIFDHIEIESPRSAVMVDEKIEAASDQLVLFPEAGRSGRILGTRELVVTGLPYILAYHVANDVVRILRVLHTSQQWPNHLPH